MIRIALFKPKANTNFNFQAVTLMASARLILITEACC